MGGAAGGDRVRHSPARSEARTGAAVRRPALAGCCHRAAAIRDCARLVFYASTDVDPSVSGDILLVAPSKDWGLYGVMSCLDRHWAKHDLSGAVKAPS